MTNLEQLAKETADVAVTKTIRTEVNGYSVNTAEIASVILAALRSVAEQKDAEAAALRSALERAHPARTWDQARMSYTGGNGIHPDTRQWHTANCEAVDKALATDAGASLLQRLEKAESACSEALKAIENANLLTGENWAVKQTLRHALSTEEEGLL